MPTATSPAPVSKRGSQRGSVTAELVVATPLLLVLLLLGVQFALWQHAAHVADAVAQQGLQAARVDGGTAGAGAGQAATVLHQLGAGVLTRPRITASRTATSARVAVSGYAEPVLPFLQLPVHAVAAGPTEVFTAGGGP